MDAVKFFKEYKRMCSEHKNCDDCPMCRVAPELAICYNKLKCHPEEAVKAVQKWSEEHPQKTRLDDFKEKYPNAVSRINGIPRACCKDLGYLPWDFVCAGITCADCWNQPID